MLELGYFVSEVCFSQVITIIKCYNGTSHQSFFVLRLVPHLDFCWTTGAERLGWWGEGLLEVRPHVKSWYSRVFRLKTARKIPPVSSSRSERWHVAPTCWCWLWWHVPPTCCCQVRASQLLRCCVAARSMRLEPWHRPPLSLRAVPCRWAWPRQVANLQGFRWSPLVSWRALRPLASWLSSSMAPTPGPAAVCEIARTFLVCVFR